MYTFNSRVRYSETGLDGRLSLDSLVNYFQDCSTFQSEDNGLGLDFLKTRGKAWVLSSWQIVVDRYPELGREIRTGTWAYQFDGFYGSRNFVMEDGESGYAAYANSLWVLVDLASGRPVRVTDDVVAGYQMEPRIEMDYASRKIVIPAEMEKCGPFPVRRYHIDTNRHVNNGRYIQMAREFIPDDFRTGQIRAEYKKAAVYGDLIFPAVSEKEGTYVVTLSDSSGKHFAVVEFGI
ncbi:acyl-[acyl-carrier-protein] thioesterase [Anaerobium acetethylicum]|uniref:Acyl-ACP thioesterase n=1 Tax=Anaerobium acetethylicum TaxID=1619234 RepID=A0A1D3TQB2_9FIRM|nr:acyl-ACP thioesterase domain-containing protein [Anaerobium acetethylicum]SCP95675.1 Acyl-ACP thioesterase [Anaerobium acetethylicum]